MFVKSAILGLMAQAAMGHVLRDATRFGCGTPEPTKEQLRVAQQMAIQEKKQSGVGIQSLTTLEVDTIVHVVSTSETDEGWLSDEKIAKQLEVMNDAYRASKVEFKHINTTRTVNQKWATNSGEVEMKTALRQGEYKTLNLYFLSSLGGGLLGYCYFPVETKVGESDFILDGCTILAASVPGGSAVPFDLGHTATHEIGHWMGLFHTFQGGCTGGDGIDDTPAQSSPSSGCPIGRDSCPRATGLDPIHNYMDYSDDACYEEFTAQQATRMRTSWDTYRV